MLVLGRHRRRVDPGAQLMVRGAWRQLHAVLVDCALAGWQLAARNRRRGPSPRGERGGVCDVASVARTGGGPGVGARIAGERGGGAAGRRAEVRRRHAAKLGVTRADVADLAVTSEYRSAHNGVTHVNVSQRHKGLRGLRRPRDDQRRSRRPRRSSPAATSCAGSTSGAAERELDAVEAVEAAADGLELDEPTGLKRAAPTPVARGTLSRRRDLGGADPGPARLPADEATACGWRGRSRSTTPRTGTSGRRPSTPRAASCSARATGRSHEKTPNPVNDGSSYRVFEFPKQDPNDGRARW